MSTAVAEAGARQELVVSPAASGRGTYRTITAALEAADDGALITIAPGRYEERLAITRSVTLAAAFGAAGAVELHASGGSAIVSVAPDLEVTGLAISADADPMAVVDIRDGRAALDGCRVTGPARIGVFAQGNGVIELRDCSIGNARGAGVVVITPGGSVVEDSVLAGAGASAVVVGEQGRLTLRGSHISEPGANGIYANGSGHVTAQDVTIVASAKAAIAVAQLASATLLRVTVEASADTDAVFDSSGLIKLTDCSFTGAALHSVHVSAAAPVLRSCTLADAAKGGLYATGGARTQLIDCDITCAEFGLVADEGSEVNLADVRVSGDDGIGIAVSGGALVTAIGGRLSGVGAVTGTDGTLRASGCEFTDSANDGVRVLGGGQLTLANCTVSGARGHGVLITDGAGAELSESAITDNRGDGVHADTAKEVRVDQCDFHDNGGRAVNDLRGTVARDQVCALRPNPGLVPTLEALIQLAEAQGQSAAPVNLDTIEHPGAENQATAHRGTGHRDGGRQAHERPVGERLMPVLPTPVRSLRPEPADVPDVPELPLPHSAQRIAALVGLDEVRALLTDRLAMMAERMANGEPLTVTPNLALIGRDGMGRRSVAALYARALAELGVLVVGDLQVVMLSEVPARWPGQAREWLAHLLGEARGGGVLLEADEGFWQRPDAERDNIFGSLPAVLAAPYALLLLSSPAEQLVPALAASEALAACFADCVPFADYTPGQLAVLAVRRLEARGHALSDDALPALAEFFETIPDAGVWDAHQFATLVSEQAGAPTITATAIRSVADAR